jgi:hypothetical protein
METFVTGTIGTSATSALRYRTMSYSWAFPTDVLDKAVDAAGIDRARNSRIAARG